MVPVLAVLDICVNLAGLAICSNFAAFISARRGMSECNNLIADLIPVYLHHERSAGGLRRSFRQKPCGNVLCRNQIGLHQRRSKEQAHGCLSLALILAGRSSSMPDTVS